MNGNERRGRLLAEAIKFAHASNPNDYTHGKTDGLLHALIIDVCGSDGRERWYDLVGIAREIVRGMPDNGRWCMSPEAVKVFVTYLRREARRIDRQRQATREAALS